jgi:hypothetical protein
MKNLNLRHLLPFKPLFFILTFLRFLSINQLAFANSPIFKSNSKNAWLEVVSVENNTIKGSFCAKRESLIGGDNPVDIRVYIDGNQIQKEYLTNYNSMSPFARNCDNNDKNSFNYPFDSAVYCSNRNQGNRIVNLKVKMWLNYEYNYEYNEISRNITLSCSQNNNYNKPVENYQSYNISDAQDKYLTFSNCSDEKYNRITRFNISNNPNNFAVCETPIRYQTFTGSVNLTNNPSFIQYSICSSSSRKLVSNWYTKFKESSSNNIIQNLCGSDKTAEISFIDIRTNKFLYVSQCYSKFNGFDIITRVSSGSQPQVVNTCSPDYTREMINGESFYIDLR